MAVFRETLEREFGIQTSNNSVSGLLSRLYTHIYIWSLEGTRDSGEELKIFLEVVN